MPSQDDYLDQLFKSMDEMVDQNIERIASEDSEQAEETVESGIEDLLADVMEDETEDDELSGGMSEEEIEQILMQNQMASQQAVSDVEKDSSNMSGESIDELLNLLDDVSEKDDNLKDIGDMLRKDENNQVIEESLLEEPDDVLDLLAEIEGEEEPTDDAMLGMSEKEKKAYLKKKEKEEKAAQKKAEKEAKKAEREALKAAKKAEREAKKKGQTAQPSTDGDTELSDENLLETGEQRESLPDHLLNQDEPLEMDMSALDALLGLNEPDEKATDEKAPVAESAPVVEKTSIAEGLADASEPIEASLEDLDALLGEKPSEDEIATLPGVELEGDDIIAELEGLDSLPEKEAPKEKEKKGLFAKIMDFLTEEDEEDAPAGGTEEIPLSDENKDILEELDKEGKKGKKKGKKPKKDKKGKKGAAEPSDGDGEEGDGGKAAKKPKKEKKPKKVKEKEPVDPRNRISFKQLLPVILACASLLVVIILLTTLGGDFTVKREAKKAFYAEDYETCYQDLYGKKLNESEQVMFGKSESILRIRLWMREYEMFTEEGAEVEALDVLIQAVHDYEKLYEYAVKWNADKDIAVIYEQMVEIMQTKYHLTEEQALEIAAIKDDVEYTRAVTKHVQDMGLVPGAPEQKPVEELPDMLPEEKNFPENNGGK